MFLYGGCPLLLLQSYPDTYNKLRILSGMAGDDVLSPSESRFVQPTSASGPRRRAKDSVTGVYSAAMPNGRFISLFRVMFTDFCMMDCAYCPNSHWVPRRRYAFTIEELAKLFMDYNNRHAAEGLFLSSGIAGSPDKTMEKLLNVVELLRKGYGFKGYIHLKVMPGTSYPYIEEAHRLGTRLSINIEVPSKEMIERMSKIKSFQKGILDPMCWIHRLNQEKEGGGVSQVTQMVVGAADESDWDIFTRIRQLYADWNLKRVYYQAFRPARYTPLEEHPATPPAREHRLYQLDWLSRIYGFSEPELRPAFGLSGFLSLDLDPKIAVSLQNLDAFPVDINHADYPALLRVPGIGPTSAKRIVENRALHTLDTWRDLQAMGVVLKRARPFVAFQGYRPEKATQGRLIPLFREQAVTYSPATAGTGYAPCGARGSCAGCPVAARGTN